MDPFSVLGVSRSATEADVKDAYRKAALQWHPDRHTSGGASVQALAAARFNEVRLTRCAATAARRVAVRSPRALLCVAPLGARREQRVALRLSPPQISRAYEYLSDPAKRREWRQRGAQQGTRSTEGWRERGAYTGAQSAAGGGPYAWRHTDMGGSRSHGYRAAEEGECSRLRRCVWSRL